MAIKGYTVPVGEGNIHTVLKVRVYNVFVDYCSYI